MRNWYLIARPRPSNCCGSSTKNTQGSRALGVFFCLPRCSVWRSSAHAFKKWSLQLLPDSICRCAPPRCRQKYRKERNERFQILACSPAVCVSLEVLFLSIPRGASVAPLVGFTLPVRCPASTWPRARPRSFGPRWRIDHHHLRIRSLRGTIQSSLAPSQFRRTSFGPQHQSTGIFIPVGLRLSVFFL